MESQRPETGEKVRDELKTMPMTMDEVAGKARLRLEQQHPHTKQAPIVCTQAESQTSSRPPRMFNFSELKRRFNAKPKSKTTKAVPRKHRQPQRTNSLAVHHKVFDGPIDDNDIVDAKHFPDFKPTAMNSGPTSIDSLMMDAKTSRDFCQSPASRLSFESLASGVYRKPPETLDVARLKSIVSDAASVAYALPPFLKEEDILIGLPSLKSLPKLVDDNEDKTKDSAQLSAAAKMEAIIIRESVSPPSATRSITTTIDSNLPTAQLISSPRSCPATESATDSPASPVRPSATESVELLRANLKAMDKDDSGESAKLSPKVSQPKQTKAGGEILPGLGKATKSLQVLRMQSPMSPKSAPNVVDDDDDVQSEHKLTSPNKVGGVCQSAGWRSVPKRGEVRPESAYAYSTLDRFTIAAKDAQSPEETFKIDNHHPKTIETQLLKGSSSDANEPKSGGGGGGGECQTSEAEHGKLTPKSMETYRTLDSFTILEDEVKSRANNREETESAIESVGLVDGQPALEQSKSAALLPKRRLLSIKQTLSNFPAPMSRPILHKPTMSAANTTLPMTLPEPMFLPFENFAIGTVERHKPIVAVKHARLLKPPGIDLLEQSETGATKKAGPKEAKGTVLIINTKQPPRTAEIQSVAGAK